MNGRVRPHPPIGGASSFETVRGLTSVTRRPDYQSDEDQIEHHLDRDDDSNRTVLAVRSPNRTVVKTVAESTWRRLWPTFNGRPIGVVHHEVDRGDEQGVNGKDEGKRSTPRGPIRSLFQDRSRGPGEARSKSPPRGLSYQSREAVPTPRGVWVGRGANTTNSWTSPSRPLAIGAAMVLWRRFLGGVA